MTAESFCRACGLEVETPRAKYCDCCASQIEATKALPPSPSQDETERLRARVAFLERVADQATKNHFYEHDGKLFCGPETHSHVSQTPELAAYLKEREA